MYSEYTPLNTSVAEIYSMYIDENRWKKPPTQYTSVGKYKEAYFDFH